MVTRKARYQSGNSCLSVSGCPLFLAGLQPIRALGAAVPIHNTRSLITTKACLPLLETRLVVWCSVTLSLSTSTIRTVPGGASVVQGTISHLSETADVTDNRTRTIASSHYSVYGDITSIRTRHGSNTRTSTYTKESGDTIPRKTKHGSDMTAESTTHTVLYPPRIVTRCNSYTAKIHHTKPAVAADEFPHTGSTIRNLGS
jgi:hypothetical protein